MPELRAIFFDLDDTLYPYRAFVRSGLKAVGRRVSSDFGLPRATVLQVVRQTLANGPRGREIQALCEHFALPASLVPSLVEIVRGHSPALRLPCLSRRVLATVRQTWKVGILTNGAASIQRRKVAALGVDRLVDAVVFATDEGDRHGKPSPSAFRAALDRLGVRPDHSVFVGDDPDADVAGASAVGMKTIHVLTNAAAGCPVRTVCGVHVRTLQEVPEIANWLVPARTECHV